MPRTHIRTLPFQARTSLVRRFAQFLTQASARRRDRKLLARLDIHMLRDIGLDPDEARTEASKPFWRP